MKQTPTVLVQDTFFGQDSVQRRVRWNWIGPAHAALRAASRTSSLTPMPPLIVPPITGPLIMPERAHDFEK